MAIWASGHQRVETSLKSHKKKCPQRKAPKAPVIVELPKFPVKMQKYRVFGWCLLARCRDWRFQPWGRSWLPDVTLEVQCKLCKKHCTAESLDKHMRAWTWEHWIAPPFFWDLIFEAFLTEWLPFIMMGNHPRWTSGYELAGLSQLCWFQCVSPNKTLWHLLKLIVGGGTQSSQHLGRLIDQRSFWGISEGQNPCEIGSYLELPAVSIRPIEVFFGIVVDTVCSACEEQASWVGVILDRHLVDFIL